MMADDERAIFDALVEGIEIEEPDIDHRFEELNNVALMKEFHRVKDDLNTRGVLLHPKTEADIDLQGYYFGLVGEMRKRKLL